MNSPPNRYAYEASTASGDVESGVVPALNVAQAVQALEAQGFSVLSIRLVRGGEPLSEQPPPFHRRLNEALERRVGWLPALQALADELAPGVVRREALRLASRLKSELSAEKVLADSGCLELLPLLSSSVHDRQSSSRLDDWLHFAVLQKQRRQQNLRALVYPALLIGLLLLVLVGSALFLIPVFRSMFSEFGLSLPAPTLLVFWVADQVTINLLRTLLCLPAIFGLLYLLVRMWRRRALTNRLFGRFVAGTSSNLWAMSSLTSALAELLSLEAPLPQALRIAGRGCNHAYFAVAAEQLAEELSNSSSPIAELPVAASPTLRRLPPMLLHALQPGAGQPPCIPLLRELSQVYRERLSGRVNWLVSSLPAFAIVLVGLIVGFVVIALFMPLVSMVTSLA